MGGTLGSGQIPDQCLHPQGGERADRQHRAQLGHRQERGPQPGQKPVHHHRALGRRLHLQPGCEPDHPHSALGCAQGHRPLRLGGQPGHPGAGADHRQLLPQRGAKRRRHRLPARPQPAPERRKTEDLRSIAGIQRGGGGHPDRRHRSAGRADEDADRPQDRRAGTGHLQHPAHGAGRPQAAGAGQGAGRHPAQRGEGRARCGNRPLQRAILR